MKLMALLSHGEVALWTLELLPPGNVGRAGIASMRLSELMRMQICCQLSSHHALMYGLQLCRCGEATPHLPVQDHK